MHGLHLVDLAFDLRSLKFSVAPVCTKPVSKSGQRLFRFADLHPHPSSGARLTRGIPQDGFQIGLPGSGCGNLGILQGIDATEPSSGLRSAIFVPLLHGSGSFFPNGDVQVSHQLQETRNVAVHGCSIQWSRCGQQMCGVMGQRQSGIEVNQTINQSLGPHVPAKRVRQQLGNPRHRPSRLPRGQESQQSEAWPPTGRRVRNNPGL